MLDRVRELRVPVRARGQGKRNYCVLGWLCSRQDLIGPKECNCHTTHTHTALVRHYYFRGLQPEQEFNSDNKSANKQQALGTRRLIRLITHVTIQMLRTSIGERCRNYLFRLGFRK